MFPGHPGCQGNAISGQENNPPLKLITEAGLIPKLVDFLKVAPLPNLQLEVAWALTNITSGTSEQTQAVVKGAPD